MKETPTVIVGYTSEKYADKYGRRFCIRLLQWDDSRLSVSLGLAQKIQGSTAPSKFTRLRLSLPVEFLSDIEYYVPLFVKTTKAKMAEIAAEQAAAKKALEDTDDSDVNTDNSSNGDDTSD